MKKVAEVSGLNYEKDAQASGNTNSDACALFLRSRAFCLTVWKLETYPEIKKYLTKMKNHRFFIAGQEIGELKEGQHIQIYVHYKNSQKISVKKLLGAHVECCRGSPQENIDYVSKQGKIIDKIGTEPRQGGKTIAEVEKMTEEERKDLPIQYYNIINKINMQQTNDIDVDDLHKDVEVYYIWGESGVGKTEKAKELVREYYKKKEGYTGKPITNMVQYVNGFWEGTGKNMETCIYDDWRDSHMKPSEFIHFIDYNIQEMNIKGGSVKNKYKLIIITSVQDFKEIYKNVDTEPRKQWERRVKVIHMEKMKKIDDSNDIEL